MKNSLLILAVVLVAISCTKDNPYDRMDHTEVKGRLLDASNGEPIEGGTIYLTDGGSWIVVDSLVTTATGEYSFKYNHEEYGYAEFWAKAPNYLSNKNIGTWSADYPIGGASGRGAVRENGRVNYENIRLPPIGYVKYHFKQVDPYAGSIEVRFLPYDNLGVVSWSGQGLNRSYTSVFPGGVHYHVGYSILRNGQLDLSVIDTLYIPRFDTLHYYHEF